MQLINTFLILVSLIVTFPSFTNAAEETPYIRIPEDSLRQPVPPELSAMTDEEMLETAAYFAQTIHDQQQKELQNMLFNMRLIPANSKPPPAPERRAKRSAAGRDLPSADQISTEIGGQLPMIDATEFFLRKGGYAHLMKAVMTSQREADSLSRSGRVKRNANNPSAPPRRSGSPKKEAPTGFIDQKKIFGL